MDSLSQFVLGSAIAEATVGKKIGRKAVLLGGVIGTLPDLDVLVRYTDSVASFTYHRSWSHSIFTLSLVSVVLAWALHRFFPSRPTLSFRQWWLCSWLILITHPLLDGFTVYGTQLLWPLPAKPIAWGSIFIIDPLYTLPLLIAVVIALTNRAKAFKAVSIALIVSCTYIALTVFSQQHARQLALASLQKQSLATKNVLVAPAPFSVLWRIVSMEGPNYHEGFYSVFDADDEISFDTYPSQRSLIDQNKTRWSVARLDWFTNGFIAGVASEERLVIKDLRMGMESSYVFRFDVGPLAELNPAQPALSTLLPLTLNPARMKALVKRVWDEETPIPTD